MNTATETGVAAAEAAAPGPGARLRAERERRGLTQQQVVDALHVEPRLVVAMESDDFEAFDAPVYARGFLRKYASFLELSGDEIIAGYEALRPGSAPPAQALATTSAEPEPRDWSRFRGPLVALALLVAVGGSYWWWFAHDPPAPRDGAPAASAPGSGASAPASPSSDGPPPAAVPGAADSAAVVAAGPTPAAKIPTPAPPAGATLELSFAADCWTEVYDAAGQRLFYDLARAGASRTFPGPGPWRVFVGNAAAVRVGVNGRRVVVPPERRAGDTARFTVDADGSIR